MSTAEEHARWLLMECKDIHESLAHAFWAKQEAEKTETKNFWHRVILELIYLKDRQVHA